MLTKVCELAYVTKSILDEDCLSVHPIITGDITVRELFSMDFMSEKNMLLYLYVWHPEEEQFIRGRISTCYDTWFLLRKLPINDIERLDYLYTRDHVEDITEEESMGIIYKKD